MLAIGDGEHRRRQRLEVDADDELELTVRGEASPVAGLGRHDSAGSTPIGAGPPSLVGDGGQRHHGQLRLQPARGDDEATG